jgi:endonuclease I
MKARLSLLLCFYAAAAFAVWRPGHYNAAAGKTGTNLFAALHLIVSTGTTNIPYSSSTALDASDALRLIDEDPANTNNVLLIYSGLSMAKNLFAVSGGWNREHLWCNSYGLDNVEPAFSDLHNLRPIDSNVNSSRGNKWYDESDPADGSVANPAHAEAPGNSADPNSWQPPDSHVGDIARAMFYMTTRYWGDRPQEPALFVTDNVASITASTNFMGRLSTLLYWNALDPVSDEERLRNDRVEALQGNRNPYVDHPEFVPAVWGDITRLNISPDGTNVVLQWPLALRRAVLEGSDDLEGDWQPVSPTLTTNVVNGIQMRTMTKDAATAPAFFRLRMK